MGVEAERVVPELREHVRATTAAAQRCESPRGVNAFMKRRSRQPTLAAREMCSMYSMCSNVLKVFPDVLNVFSIWVRCFRVPSCETIESPKLSLLVS